MKVFLKRENGSYSCPCCACTVAALACPTCAAPIPPNYCSMCGFSMGVYACPACAQPQPSSPELQEAVAEAAAEAHVVLGELRVACLTQPGTEFEMRRVDGKLQGFVTAYASSEVRDSKGSILDQLQVLDLLTGARVDLQHNEQEIEGLCILSREKGHRTIEGKPTILTKVELAFDLAKRAAKEAFDGIVSGVYKGLSLGFWALKSNIDKVKKGITDHLPVESIPWLSIVDDPSNAYATVADYRSKGEPPAPVVEPIAAPVTEPPAPIADPSPSEPPPVVPDPAQVGARFDGITAAAKTEPPVVEPEIRSAPEVTPDMLVSQNRAELVSLIEQTDHATRGFVTGFLNEHVAPSVDAVREYAARSIDAIKTQHAHELHALEKRMEKRMADQIAALSLAPPTREVAIEVEEPALPALPAEPTRYPSTAGFRR